MPILPQTAWKVSVFGVFLVRIFPHSDWIRRDKNGDIQLWKTKKLYFNNKCTEWINIASMRYVKASSINDLYSTTGETFCWKNSIAVLWFRRWDFFYVVCEEMFKWRLYDNEGQFCLMHFFVFFDIKRSFQISLYITSCYRTLPSAIWEIFSYFLIFCNLFHGPLGERNNSKIWETRKIFANIASHCVKTVRIWSFSGPYFPTFGLNTGDTESECGKIRTRKTPNTDTFNTVWGNVRWLLY